MWKLIIVYFSIIFYSTLSAENQTESLHTISESKVRNAKWQVPDDGETPVLKSYDLEFTIEEGHSFSLTNIDANELKFNSFKAGDIIKIDKEGLDIKDRNHSWFQIENMGNDIVFIFYGLNRHLQKIYSTEGSDYILSNVSIRKMGDVNYLEFIIKNDYFSLPVEDRFHGLYEGLPIKIIEEELSDENFLGERFVKATFLNLQTQEEVNVVSLPTKENVRGTVKSIKILKANPGTNHTGTTWKDYELEYELEDNQLLYGYQRIKSPFWVPDEARFFLQPGDEIELSQENYSRDNPLFSHFTIHNLTRPEQPANMGWQPATISIMRGIARKMKPHYNLEDNVEYIIGIRGAFIPHHMIYQGPGNGVEVMEIQTTHNKSFKLHTSRTCVYGHDEYICEYSPAENKTFDNSLYIGAPVQFLDNGVVQLLPSGLTFRDS